MIRKVLRKILIGLAIFVGIIVVFLLAAIGLVDRTPAAQLAGYDETFQEIENLQISRDTVVSSLFSIGYSKINLTPSAPVALAGYGNRKGKHYTKVADSIFVRSIVVDNGSKKIAFVSADLLLIPPKVSKALEEQLPSIGYSIDNVFLGATHTHNSIGNWGEGAAGIIYGSYEESMIQFITSKIISSILAASENTVEGTIKYGKIANDSAVANRLIKGGPEDPYLRLIEFSRRDSVKLLLATYSAHATCLFSRDLELSRDYPGKFVDELENNGYDFAMFMAGAVGSHRPAAPAYGWGCFDWMADELVTSVKQNANHFKLLKGFDVAIVRIPLHLSDPQVKVTPSLKVRSWLFRSAVGEYPVYISGVRMGDLVMLGVPADFSGEFNSHLDSIAAQQNVNLITTSFNGGYIGYLTPQEYYDNKYFETQFMNWYAPGTGEFVRDVMGETLKKIQDPKSRIKIPNR